MRGGIPHVPLKPRIVLTNMHKLPEPPYRLGGVTTVDWLLDSDPAIRWQVLRDLVHAPAEVVMRERARIAVGGWGARLLALQGGDGQWAGGACFPGRHLKESDGKPWPALDRYASHTSTAA
jgi:hypothetical protein